MRSEGRPFPPAGSSALLLFAPGDPLAAPLSTPFGERDLDRRAARDLSVTAVGAGPPALRVLQVPADSNLAGLTLTFQALPTSGVPAPPWTLTNALTLVVQP